MDLAKPKSEASVSLFFSNFNLLRVANINYLLKMSIHNHETR